MVTRNPDDDLGEPDVEGARAVLAKTLPDEVEVSAELLDPDGLDIPDDLTFTTTSDDDEAEDKPGDGDVLEIKLDDDILVARKPASAAYTLILGAVSQAATEADKTQAMLTFVYSAFDPVSQIIIKQRLLNPADKFDADILARIMDRLLEKWSPAQSRAERRAAMLANKRNGKNSGPRRR